MSNLIKAILEKSGQLGYKVGLGMAFIGMAIIMGVLAPLVQQLQENQLDKEQLLKQVTEIHTFKHLQEDNEKKLEALLQKQKALRRVVRDEADVSSIGEALQKAAEELGLVLREMKLPEKGSGVAKAGVKGIKEHNIYLVLCGNYEAILAYLKQMEQDKVLMDNISIIGDPNGREIRLECRINIYTLVAVKE